MVSNFGATSCCAALFLLLFPGFESINPIMVELFRKNKDFFVYLLLATFGARWFIFVLVFCTKFVFIKALCASQEAFSSLFVCLHKKTLLDY
jgi:hypothetical protein